MLPDLQTLCRAVPVMCRIAAHPDVQRLLDRAAEARDHHAAVLLEAAAAFAARHPDGQYLPQPITPELMGYLHLCRQSSAGEILSVLTACTVSPSPEVLALLLSRQRQQQSRELYALQLLWRIHGDERIPDALSLFRKPDASSGNAGDIRSRLLHDLTQRRPA